MGIAERKEREKEKRRNDIIDAAEKVFFNKGFHFSTMDEVAKEAELSKGTLYLYFKNKSELHFAIMERGAEILTKMMEKSLDESKTGLENLTELALTFVSFYEKYPDYFNAMMFFEGQDYTSHNIDNEKMINFFREKAPVNILFKSVERGMKDGSLRVDKRLEEFVMTLWAQMLGILIVYNSKKMIFELHGMTKEDLVRNHLDLIQYGIIKQ
jgi:AcrR family transcriptional regulator